jgi:hypothetical protein
MFRRIAAAIAVTVFALLLRPAAAPPQVPAGTVVLPSAGRNALPSDQPIRPGISRLTLQPEP